MLATTLNAMLSLDESKPRREALAVFTGGRQLSGQAMVDCFAPLKTWLDEQKRGPPTGW